MTDSQKLDLLLERTTAMAQDIAELKEDMAEVKRRITNLEKDVSEMKPRISNLEEDVKDLKEQMDYVKGDVKILKLNFENELRVSIKRVAEAHLDLPITPSAIPKMIPKGIRNPNTSPVSLNCTNVIIGR